MTGQVTIEPTSPPRKSFGIDPGTPLSHFEREAMGAFLGGRAEAGLTSAACDPVLGDVATAHARIHLEHGGRLAAAASEPVLTWAGAADPHPQYHILEAHNADDQDLVDHARSLGARRDPGAVGWTALGFGRASEGRRTVFVVVTSARAFELSSLPRRFEPGDRVSVSGRLAPGFADPELLFLPPRGEVTRAALAGESPDGSVDWSFTLPAESGDVLVEVLAIGPRGPTVAALLTLSVGAEPPRQLRLVPPPDESDVTGPDDAARRVFERINMERRERGLAVLEWDTRVAHDATGHARDSAQSGILAHVAPDGRTPADRVRASGVSAARVTENLARNRSLADAHAALMRSLGHRKNILDDAVTHLGVGVAVLGSGSEREFVVVCKFVRLVERIEVGRDREILRQRLNDRRRQEGLAPLARDPGLDELAQAAAQRVLADDSVRSRSGGELIDAALRGRGDRWSRWAMQSFLVALPLEEAVDSDLVRDGRATHLGIGLAQGELRRGEVRTAVVQLTARARR